MARKEIYEDFSLLLTDLQFDLIETAYEVAEEIKDIEAEVIDETVYNAYDSNIDRRMDNGGLSDKSNMKEEIVSIKDGVTIEVTNETKGNSNYSTMDGYTSDFIADIIEDSEGYGYGLDDYIPKRPFQEITQNYIDYTDRVDKVVEKSLDKKGW